MKNSTVIPPNSSAASSAKSNLKTYVSSWAAGCALSCCLLPFASAQDSKNVGPLDLWQPGQLTTPITQNDPHNDVRQLLRQAKFTQAIALVNKALQKNPRDPQMRFWQAFIHERMGQPELALPIYLALTQEYPELAEPHNNLGVLYAAQGDYEKARAAIEAAIRSNPSYAMAYENLGDVLVAIAKLAYTRALELDGKNTSTSRKIDALKPALQRIESKP